MSGPGLQLATVRPGQPQGTKATRDVLTATNIQKNVTERCGPEMVSSTFRAMTPPRTAETPAITSMTCRGHGWWRQCHQGTQDRLPRVPRTRVSAGWGGQSGNRVERLRMTSQRILKMNAFQAKINRKRKGEAPTYSEEGRQGGKRR